MEAKNVKAILMVGDMMLCTASQKSLSKIDNGNSQDYLIGPRELLQYAVAGEGRYWSENPTEEEKKHKQLHYNEERRIPDHLSNDQ